MASRLVTDCHPILQPMLRACIVGWANEHLDVLVTCTWRSGQEQNLLYAQGRTAPGNIVTNAKAGQSAHNFTIEGRPASLAFDFVPMLNGKPDWNGTGADFVLWSRAAAVAKRAGLKWYGEPGAPFHELPHCEHPDAVAMRSRL